MHDVPAGIPELMGVLLEHLLEARKLRDLRPRLAADGSAEQAHKAGRLHVEGKGDGCAVLADGGQIEPAGRPDRAGGDLETQYPRRLVDGHQVIAGDATPAGAAQYLPV